jgi:hypothetical protein
MRTTVNVTPIILENAKAAAVGRGVTLGELLEDALRAYLSSVGQTATAPFKLHSVRGQLVQPNIDLDRTSALIVADDELSYTKPS